MKVKEVIEELKKFNPELEVVNGDGGNGFFLIDIKTIKDCTEEEYLEEICDEYEVTPDTPTIISELC